MRSREKSALPWPDAVVRRWAEPRSGQSIAADISIRAEAARTAPWPDWISPGVCRALQQAGVDAPYSHQVEAWEHVAGGRNLVIATPTASGKTLCYTVPILDSLMKSECSRAMCLFPTKALARDQEEALLRFTRAAGFGGKVAVYDGDTPAELRRAARQEASILITNPDMLHMAILPHHADWAAFFRGLRFIVIDELHAYRGVFGSHVANVMRRLWRIAEFHGSRPTVVASSATIANPRGLAEAIAGRRFELVDRSGAPEGPRRLVVYNPELVDPASGMRRSTLKEAARLAGDLVEASVKTLVFCQTRASVELVLRYLRDQVADRKGAPDRIRGYRGGYLPTVRREIEAALRDGSLDAVVATNALELGIDIGSLDAVVMAGYPGTIAGFRQRAGRAGRRQGPSLAVLVASPSPLDQFLAREPAFLTGETPEQALVQPDNPEILLAHLRCAVFELPIAAGERFGALAAEETSAAMESLAGEGGVSLSRGRYHYIGEAYPAAGISLRNILADRVVAIDAAEGQAIAEIDVDAARRELHEQAIYLHEGRTYLVEQLDLASKRAFVKKVEPVYYTRPIADVSLAVIDRRGTRPMPGGCVETGDVRVTETITGFKKIRFHTHENLGLGPVDLAPQSMETEATWIVPGRALFRALQRFEGASLMRGIEGLGYATHKIAALRLMCDPRDLAYAAQPMADPASDEGDRLALCFYDLHAGGVGLSTQLFEEILPILDDVKRLVAGCACRAGCPSCVGPFEEGSPVAKAAAGALARGLAGLAAVS